MILNPLPHYDLWRDTHLFWRDQLVGQLNTHQAETAGGSCYLNRDKIRTRRSFECRKSMCHTVYLQCCAGEETWWAVEDCEHNVQTRLSHLYYIMCPVSVPKIETIMRQLFFSGAIKGRKLPHMHTFVFTGVFARLLETNLCKKWNKNEHTKQSCLSFLLIWFRLPLTHQYWVTEPGGAYYQHVLISIDEICRCAPCTLTYNLNAFVPIPFQRFCCFFSCALSKFCHSSAETSICGGKHTH